jgi:hypothetical protein
LSVARPPQPTRCPEQLPRQKEQRAWAVRGCSQIVTEGGYGEPSLGQRGQLGSGQAFKITPRTDAHLEVTTCSKTIKNGSLCNRMWLQLLGQF